MSDLHIPTPCHASWNDMTPTANGRHCASCDHTVLDLTNMPVTHGRQLLAEVATTLQSSSKRLCVRAHATPKGRLVPGRRKLLTPALATLLACTMAGCVGAGPELGSAPQPPAPPTIQPTSTMTGTPVVRPAPQPQVEAVLGDVCIGPTIGTVAPPVEPAPVTKGKVVAQ
jgi:hypothetical protein